jgi:hypothetical protein
LSSSKCPVFLHVLTGGVAGKNVWKGKPSWSVKALRRMINAYLNKSWQYAEPTEEQWQEWISNPRRYLSVNDRKAFGR